MIFGVYLLITGAGFAAVPNALLDVLEQPSTDEPWIRVLGVIVCVLGAYYVAAAREGAVWFFWTTIAIRTLIPLAFGALVVLADAPALLMAFAMVDVLGALWTWAALRRS